MILPRIRRLLTMAPDEILDRGRQEAAKRLERVRRPRSRLHGDPRRLVDRVRTTPNSWFFEGGTNAETAALIARSMPQSRVAVIGDADAACRGRFDVLGYRGLSFGDPIDFCLDPVSGRRAPAAHWSRIDPLNAAAVGDSKVVWELNRHQWLVRLGQAYRLTGDEAYAAAFDRFLRHWIRANPRGRGINWVSSLELAYRLIAWSWALVLFRGSPTLSDELYVDVLTSMWGHASHVERYLSRFFSPNTHLTGEALGLVYAGCLFGESSQARRWRELGARTLIEETERQVLRDGVYFEQSTWYQRYTVDIYLHFTLLAARNGLSLPPGLADRVQQMVDVLLALRHPDGSMPQIGDDDGGWVLPFDPVARQDFSAMFSTAAVVFRRADYAWAAGAVAPETVWLLGPAATERFGALPPSPPTGAPSRVFGDGGYVTMRSGWDADAHHVIFDVGPLGCSISGAHGHADLLAIHAAFHGQPFLVDGGTYGYTADPEWRDFFRSTAAHSTVVVDGASQAVPRGPFGWERRPRATLHAFTSTAALEVADASHDAYGRLADPVIHRRRVAFVKPRYFIVIDDLDGAAEHRVDLRFQFAPIDVSIDPGLWAHARGSNGRGLFVRAFAAVPLKANVAEGELAPIQGWISTAYGRRQPAPVLVYTAVTTLPLRLVTLLVPVDDHSSAAPSVSLLTDERSTPVGLDWGRAGGRVQFDGAAVTLESTAEVSSE